MVEKFKEAFGDISWYNGYDEWMLSIADELERANSFYPCPVPTEEWNSDKHALWMILVGLFGDWGTSIRSGWIEDTKSAAAFIRETVKEDADAEN